MVCVYKHLHSSLLFTCSRTFYALSFYVCGLLFVGCYVLCLWGLTGFTDEKTSLSFLAGSGWFMLVTTGLAGE